MGPQIMGCCCGPPAGPVGGCLPWPPCPALPLPCPAPALALFLSPQTDTTFALIYKMYQNHYMISPFLVFFS